MVQNDTEVYEVFQNDFKDIEFTNLLRRLNIILINKTGQEYLNTILNEFEPEIEYSYCEAFLYSGEIKSLYNYNYKCSQQNILSKSINDIINKSDNPILELKKQFNKDNSIVLIDNDKANRNIFLLILNLKNRNSINFIGKIFDIYIPCIKHQLDFIPAKIDDYNKTDFRWSKKLIDESPTGILQLDKEMRITYKNPALKKMMNDPDDNPSIYLGIKVSDLQSVQKAGLEQIIQRIYNGEVIENYQTEFTSIYGVTVFISIYSIPLHDQNDNFDGAIISIKDISKEKEYKNALQQTEDKFSTIFNSAEEAISIHNHETGLVEEFNYAYTKIFGFTNEDLSELNNISNDDENEYSSKKAVNIIKSLNLNDYTQFEWFGTKKNGERIWTEVAVKCVEINKKKKVIAMQKDISIRKSYLNELNQSRQKYKALFETAGDAILLIKDDKIIECNKKTLELFKCKNEDLIGFSPLDFSPDIQENGLLTLEYGCNRFEAAFEKGPQTFEWKHLAFDGQIFDVEVVLNAIDTQNKISIAILRDISERKAYLTQLMYEKTFSEALINSMHATFFIYNSEGKLIKWNSNMVAFTGYTDEELYNFDLLDWFDGYSKERVIEEFPKLFGDTKHLSLMINTKMKSGELIPYLYTASTFEIDGIKYAIGTGIDISEWKDIEDAYLESEEKYRNLVNNAVEGILIIQEDRIKFANPMAESIFDKNSGELLETDFLSLISINDHQKLINLFENKHTTQSAELRINTENENKWIECKSIQINWANSTATLVFISEITNRINTELSLFNSENALKTFINALPSPAFLMNTDGIILVANNALVNRHNSTNDEITNSYAFQYIEEPHRTERYNIFLKCINTQKPVIINDYRNDKYYIDHFYPIVNSESEVFSVAMISIDITDLKEIEKQLATSEERYRNLFENADEGIAVIQNSKIVLMNKKVREIISIKHIDLHNTPFFDIVHPDDKDNLIDAHKNRLNGFEFDNKLRFRIIADNDTIKWLETSTVLISFEGAPATLSFISDITSQIEADNKIYLQTHAMDSAIYAIALFDLLGNITYLNDAFVDLFSFGTKAEFLSSNIYQYEHIIDIKDISEKVISQGHAIGEIFIQFNNNWVQYSISLVKDAFGEPIQIMASFIDITQKKNAEAVIYKLNFELEEKVIERTAELNETLQKLESSNYELLQLNEELANGSRNLLQLNEKLSESQQELKTANDTKDKFISILAHDLKNPLQSIIMISEILVRYGSSLDNKTSATKTTQIYDTAIKINDLLANLLTWSKSQSGKIEYKPEKTNICELTEKSIKLFNGLAQQKNIKIINNIQFYQDILIDKNQIDTVIRNLISNAIKFTNPNGEIFLSSEIDLDYYHFSVKDTGIGISEADLKKLFRIDVSPTTIGTSKEKGTGLGLLLCKEFIEKHNGNISVNSTPGIGTEFIFSLPVNK